MKRYNIAVAGTGYVGLSIAVLLSQHHTVKAVDIIPEKVAMINDRRSPIQDEYIEKYLHELFNKTAIFLTFYDQTGTNRASNISHGKLLEALKARDEDAAIAATKADIECAASCITIA